VLRLFYRFEIKLYLIALKQNMCGLCLIWIIWKQYSSRDVYL